MNLNIRFAILLYFSLVIYPVVYHWGWSGSGWASAYRSTFEYNLLIGKKILSGCDVIL